MVIMTTALGDSTRGSKGRAFSVEKDPSNTPTVEFQKMKPGPVDSLKSEEFSTRAANLGCEAKKTDTPLETLAFSVNSPWDEIVRGPEEDEKFKKVFELL
jgi:hypothetical protein